MQYCRSFNYPQSFRAIADMYTKLRLINFVSKKSRCEAEANHLSWAERIKSFTTFMAHASITVPKIIDKSIRANSTRVSTCVEAVSRLNVAE